jgi:endonuclease/exonuclease/phosphatase family metal-dependent hydrolase
MKTLKKILLGLNILAAALLILVYFSVYISPEKTLLVALLPFIYIILLIVNSVFVVIWLFLNWKLSLVSFVAIVIGIKFLNLVFPLGSILSSENKPGDLKIMTYNVMLFGLYNWDENANIKWKIINEIKEEDPDILCLQEAYWNKTNKSFVTIDSIKLVLDTKFVFKSAMATAVGGQNFGLVTISKFPIVYERSTKFDSSYNGFIITDLLINKDTVRVYNCHLQSIQLDQNDYTVIETFAEKDDNTKIKIILKKFLSSYKKRASQAEMIAASIDSSKYPVFVCGDFNDGPLTYTYFKISKGLKDSFSTNGKYPGYTWENFKLKQRIDYILYDDKFDCTSHKVINKSLSDHFSVVGEFNFPKSD